MVAELQANETDQQVCRQHEGAQQVRGLTDEALCGEKAAAVARCPFPASHWNGFPFAASAEAKNSKL